MAKFKFVYKFFEYIKILKEICKSIYNNFFSLVFKHNFYEINGDQRKTCFFCLKPIFLHTS